MGRYANHSQEVLYRDGKLVGLNAGYGYYSEHEAKYRGSEQMKSGRKDKNRNHPFNGEIVENPRAINMMKFSDGNVWITNDMLKYMRLMQMSEQERYEKMQNYINNDDRKRYEEYFAQPEAPEIVALWTARGKFDLISTNNQSSELLKNLYKEMQKGNVAISSDYSFMFKDRGLSFVLLDQLTREDLLKKQLVDRCGEIEKKLEKEYNEFLKKEGLSGFEADMNYPLIFDNVQVEGLVENDKGIFPNFYLELYHIDHGEWDNNSCLFNVTRHMSGDEIKFLANVAKSKEFIEFADGHSKEDIEAYINEQLELYHEQPREIEEQGYEIEKDSIEAITKELKSEAVEKRKMSLKDKISKWLHHEKEKNNRDK